MSKLTFIIVLLFSLSALTLSKSIKKNSHHSFHSKHLIEELNAITDDPLPLEELPAESEAPAENPEPANDEACFEDVNCHRNLLFVDSEGCTRTKECNDDGNCEAQIACPAVVDFQGWNQEVDDKTCIEDPNCHRSVTYCYFEGCCALKECPPDSNGECLVTLPPCATVHDKPELNDEECFEDDECYRNVTLCYFGDCCSYKTCSEGYCSLVMASCVMSYEEESLTPEGTDDGSPSGEGPSTDLDDEACFNDDACHRSVSVVDSDGCRRSKECDDEGNCEVFTYCPIAVDYENSSEEVDDKTCLDDPNCQRSVTYCYFEGCCAYKECPPGDECFTLMPICATVHDKPELNDDECFWDDECYRNITSCDGGCCGQKFCSGGYCSVAIPMCIQPEPEIYVPEVVLITNEQCLLDPECTVSVTYCWSENCCGAKACDENGKCAVIIPECRNHPEECAVEPPGPGHNGDESPSNEEPSAELGDDKACLEDPNCQRSVTYCYFEDCCASKECPPGGECLVNMPLCATVHDKPELNDDECFWDNDCYRNITSCDSSGRCCGEKFCSEGYCSLAIPRCVAPEVEISVPEAEMTELNDEECLNNPDCNRNVNFCYFEDCCASKECPPEGGECLVIMPLCATVHDKPELNDDECFWDDECYRNITSCPPGGCCGEKYCSGGYCSVAIPECIQPPMEAIPEPEPIMITAEECLLDPECKVDVTYCWSENCCGAKKCDENGKCAVIIPECRNHPEECAVEPPRDEPNELIQLKKASDESGSALAHNHHSKLFNKLKAKKDKDI